MGSARGAGRGISAGLPLHRLPHLPSSTTQHSRRTPRTGLEETPMQWLGKLANMPPFGRRRWFRVPIRWNMKDLGARERGRGEEEVSGGCGLGRGGWGDEWGWGKGMGTGAAGGGPEASGEVACQQSRGWSGDRTGMAGAVCRAEGGGAIDGEVGEGCCLSHLTRPRLAPPMVPA